MSNPCSFVNSSLDVRTNVKTVHEVDLVNIACHGSGEHMGSRKETMPVREGLTGESKVLVIRDSGCNSVLVKRELIQEGEYTGKEVSCILADGTKRMFPVARINVHNPFYEGQVEALSMENPVYDLVIGNIEGARAADDPNLNWKDEVSSMEESIKDGMAQCEVSAVETRAQKQKGKMKTSLKVPEPINDISPEQIRQYQLSDETLNDVRDKGTTGEIINCKDGSTVQYYVKQGLYYRLYTCAGDDPQIFRQVIVPQKLRLCVLQTAHDGIMSGHFGIRKTTDKILSKFYWPGLRSDVRNYCKSCDTCQKTFPKGRVSKFPLGKMPLIDTPFSRVAIDLIGPIHPPSDEGHRFVLTVVDYATRYPEAVARKRIDTESVAEALIEIYSRVGIPREVLSDQGKHFTSDLMKEVSRLLSVRQLTTTPYHPSCNGLVERFNGTLKSMLRKCCEEQPRQWNRLIPALLFAYRDSVQDSTGCTPFQLLYGHQVRGPLTILRELWTRDFEDEEVKTTYQYVVDLRQRLEETCKIAQEELSKSSKNYKTYYDMKTKDRQFKTGEEVLLLLPSDNNKF